MEEKLDINRFIEKLLPIENVGELLSMLDATLRSWPIDCWNNSSGHCVENTITQQTEFVGLLGIMLHEVVDKNTLTGNWSNLYVDTSGTSFEDGRIVGGGVILDANKGILPRNKALIQKWVEAHGSGIGTIASEPKPKGSKSSEPLTTKQQIILLDLLGLLKTFNNMDVTKQGELFSALINRDKKNTTDAITYFSQEKREKSALHNPANPKAVIELLENIGLDKLAEAGKEKYKDSLSREKKIE